MPFYCTHTGFSKLEEAPLGTFYHHDNDDTCVDGQDELPRFTYMSLGATHPLYKTSIACMRVTPDIGTIINHTPFIGRDNTTCIIEWRPE